MAESAHGPASPLPMNSLPRGVSQRFEDGALRVSLPLEVYGLPALFRACYRLTDHSFVYLSPPQGGLIEVTLIAKTGQVTDTDQLAGRFLNDLIDQRLRVDIGEETRAIRELIVAQAFAAVDVIDDQGSPVDQREKSAAEPGDDPQGLTQWRPVS
jgi:His-Xaa-Ser system protein HxsD